jgi:FKBP-type peptidyl-prolyl cis-trans isomerase
MSSNVGQRIFAFTMAAVFIISACAFSAFVVYDMQQSRKKEGAVKAAQDQAKANSSAGKQLENYEPVKEVPTLQATDVKVGDGDEAKPGDTITVDYTGAVAATGVIFQSSKDSGQPATLSLDSVIEGWKQGIPGMKVNGQRRLLIPAELAYGANPPQGSGIPPNAPLVFDITLHKVEASKTSETPAPEQAPAPEPPSAEGGTQQNGQ